MSRALSMHLIYNLLNVLGRAEHENGNRFIIKQRWLSCLHHWTIIVPVSSFRVGEFNLSLLLEKLAWVKAKRSISRADVPRSLAYRPVLTSLTLDWVEWHIHWRYHRERSGFLLLGEQLTELQVGPVEDRDIIMIHTVATSNLTLASCMFSDITINFVGQGWHSFKSLSLRTIAGLVPSLRRVSREVYGLANLSFLVQDCCVNFVIRWTHPLRVLTLV